MNGELARIGGVLGALGLAALFLLPRRTQRLAGLVAWAVGCGALAISLAPSGHQRAYAAAAVAGIVAAGLLGLLFHRVPWLLAMAVLACAPARIPVKLGATKANLLLPLYVVVAGAVVALAWQLWRGDRRFRELGAIAWPAALFVVWSGISMLWSQDRSAGAKDLLFYVFPLALLAVSLARLPWRPRWVKAAYVQLAAMALVFAAIGIEQYLTRDIYWNPKLAVDNAYTTASWFYRVNSVFYDPSIYGRFLVVAILASLVLVLFDKTGVAWAALLVISVTLVGLVPSFSQSSFVSLAVGIAVALVVLWRRRAILPLLIAAGALVVVTFGVPQIHHRIFGKAGLTHATGGRSKLVSGGIRIAEHHPLVGVGVGGFVNAYRVQEHVHGTKDAASHDTAITVAAELGAPGLAFFAWLVGVGLLLPFRRNPGRSTTDHARLGFGLALIAIFVHSLFYNALFEDPLFWGFLGVSALAASPPEPVAAPTAPTSGKPATVPS